MDADADMLMGLLDSEVPPVTAEARDDDDDAANDDDAGSDDDDGDQEASSDDDEDIDDEESEESDRPKKKKGSKKKSARRQRKGKRSREDDALRKKGSKYFDTAAASGDDDEESEEDDDDNMNEGSDAAGEENVDTSYLDNYKQKRGFFAEDEEDLDEKELANRIKDRYKAQAKAEKAKAELAQSFSAAALAQKQAPPALRTVQGMRGEALYNPKNDPKLFAVKVRPGFAKIVVARLVNKCQDYLEGRNPSKQRQDLGIISVFSFDHIKEWIYVESFRQRFVDNALNGMDLVFKFRVHAVDPKDIVAMFAYAKVEDLIPGRLCRLRAGIYKNDLAQILSVEDGGNRVTVRVVPRENFIGKAFEKLKWKKGDDVPPQRFFVRELAKNVLDKRGSTEVRWGDLTFDAEGYLVKTLPSRNVAAGAKLSPAPNTEELGFFYKNDVEKVRDALRHLGDLTQGAAASSSSGNGSSGTALGVDPSTLHKGDAVVATRGALKGFVGRVEGTQKLRDGRTILSLADDRGRELRVFSEEIAHHFVDGDHIAVYRGPFAGESGTVVAMLEGSQLAVLTDRGGKEVVVRAEDCKNTKLVSSGAPSGGNGFKLHDLVTIGSDSQLGCIVEIQRHQLRVIGIDGRSAVAALGSAKHVPDTRAAVTDAYGNTIKRGDAVTIVRDQSLLADGISSSSASSLANMTGKVVQVFGKNVFVQLNPKTVSESIKASRNLLQVFPAATMVVYGGRQKPARTELQPRMREATVKPVHAVSGGTRQTQLDMVSAGYSEADVTAVYEPVVVNQNEFDDRSFFASQ